MLNLKNPTFKLGQNALSVVAAVVARQPYTETTEMSSGPKKVQESKEGTGNEGEWVQLKMKVKEAESQEPFSRSIPNLHQRSHNISASSLPFTTSSSSTGPTWTSREHCVLITHLSARSRKLS